MPGGGGPGGPGGSGGPGGGGRGGGGPGNNQAPFQPQPAPPHPNAVLGVNPGDDQFASKVYAKLTRKDWEDYKERFLPREQELADYLLSDDSLNEAQDRFSAQAADRHQAGLRDLDQRLARYGVSQTSDQRAVNKRLAGLEYAKGRDAGATMLARADRDRKLALAGGGLGSVTAGGPY